MSKKVFTVLQCIYLCCSGNPKVSKCRVLPTVIGGKESNPGNYPWMVSLQEDSGLGDGAYEHVCGASVLNENWLVTAAHCMRFDEPYMYQAVAGLHKLSDLNGPNIQVNKISKIVEHRYYDDNTQQNDIALLKTTKPIDIAGSKGYVKAINLPRSESDPTGYATVIGWGHTYEDGENSDTLRVVNVPIISRDVCKDSYEKEFLKIVKTMICAGCKNKDSCQNDSGGPLFQTSSKGVSTLIGIVSQGVGCGEKGFPGVYTKVSSYLSWIKKVIAKN